MSVSTLRLAARLEEATYQLLAGVDCILLAAISPQIQRYEANASTVRASDRAKDVSSSATVDGKQDEVRHDCQPSGDNTLSQTTANTATYKPNSDRV